MAKYVRFKGVAPQYEPSGTGRGSQWWPGELRRVSDSVAATLSAGSRGWEVESPGPFNSQREAIIPDGFTSEALQDAHDMAARKAGRLTLTGRPTTSQHQFHSGRTRFTLLATTARSIAAA
jgi:hypothetical protein